MLVLFWVVARGENAWGREMRRVLELELGLHEWEEKSQPPTANDDDSKLPCRLDVCIHVSFQSRDAVK